MRKAFTTTRTVRWAEVCVTEGFDSSPGHHGDVMKRRKLYGIFMVFRNGRILGYVENSFSMSWERDYVRLWSKNDVDLILNDSDIKGARRRYRSAKIIVVRLSARNKSLPLKLDWAGRWVETKKKKKFHYRNIRFEVIPEETCECAERSKSDRE